MLYTTEQNVILVKEPKKLFEKVKVLTGEFVSDNICLHMGYIQTAVEDGQSYLNDIYEFGREKDVEFIIFTNENI